MPSESGDMKLVGNFSRLIELVSIEPNYNPANPSLKVLALNAQKTAAQAAVDDIGTKEAPFKAAVNDRQARGLFIKVRVPSRTTRVAYLITRVA